jgi:hypothetical protein
MLPSMETIRTDIRIIGVYIPYNVGPFMSVNFRTKRLLNPSCFPNYASVLEVKSKNFFF